MSYIRSTKPGKGDKYFIRKASGGFSSCITGSPKDPNCDVLANCVGYACGAFNETVAKGFEKYYLNCNAENFIERAISLGLSIVKDPVVGGIMVWQKGATLSGSDGAGHVAYVYAKPNNDQVKTSESGYGSSAFWTATRNRGNGHWGAGTGYTYRGCIVNPNVTPEPPKPTPTYKFNIGDKVVINGPLFSSSNASSPVGHITDKVTNITRRADGAAHPYNTNGDLGWMDEDTIKLYVEPTPPAPAPEPTPDPTINVGDSVIVNGRGTGDSYGGGAKTREFSNVVMKVIYARKDGRPRPYALNQYNQSNGVTGWWSEDQVREA